MVAISKGNIVMYLTYLSELEILILPVNEFLIVS